MAPLCKHVLTGGMSISIRDMWQIQGHTHTHYIRRCTDKKKQWGSSGSVMSAWYQMKTLRGGRSNHLVISHTHWFPLASLTQMAAFITAIFSSVVFLMWEASTNTGRDPYKWHDTDCCPLVHTYGQVDLAGRYMMCTIQGQAGNTV